MSTAQIIILGVGVLIVLTSFDLKSLFNKAKESLKANPDGYQPVPTPKTVTVPPVSPVQEKDDLVEVVKKWDDLKETCAVLGLNEAVEKLNEIFPMLIKVDK
jgi:hypothetical protein